MTPARADCSFHLFGRCHGQDGDPCCIAEPRTELTDIGEQYVIPGCERDPSRGPKQGSLWE
jgi:hypothetical protein